MFPSKEPALGFTNRILGFGFGFGLRWIEIGLGFSESSESRGRSSWSWLEEDEERDKREEIERDSQSESFNRGRLSELFSNEDDVVLLLRWRRFLNDLLEDGVVDDDVVLLEVVVEFW